MLYALLALSPDYVTDHASQFGRLPLLDGK